MDIKVGEYIRLKDGYIRKYIKRSLDNHIILDEVYEGFKYLTSIEEKEEIVKHSKNIIDLIEVGDYVNGIKVINILPETFGRCKSIELANHYIINWLDFRDIKTIVTKEQFKNVMYEVKV